MLALFSAAAFSGAVLTSLTSRSCLAATIRVACGHGTWLEPEDAAEACAKAIAALSFSPELSTCPLLPQGELSFAPSVSRANRFAVAESLAYEGDARAMQTLGLLHYAGVGGASKCDRASAQWHAAAAAQGNVDALATLGGCVRRGVGADQHETVGLCLIEAAAAVGAPVGLVKLGVLHDEGESGKQQDSWLAAQHFEAAAAQGSALGLFHHGWALINGIGVRRDVESGFEAWARACACAPDDGAEEAAFHLYEARGKMNENQVAVYRPGKCLRLAADLGFDDAVRELRRREKNRKAREIYGASASKRKPGQDKFIRGDIQKARSWTKREARGEAFLD